MFYKLSIEFTIRKVCFVDHKRQTSLFKNLGSRYFGLDVKSDGEDVAVFYYILFTFEVEFSLGFDSFFAA